jgi:hypothetical protein
VGLLGRVVGLARRLPSFVAVLLPRLAGLFVYYLGLVLFARFMFCCLGQAIPLGVGVG